MGYLLMVRRIVILLRKTGRTWLTASGITGGILTRVRIKYGVLRVLVLCRPLPICVSRKSAMTKNVKATVGNSVVVLLGSNLFCFFLGVNVISRVRGKGSPLVNRLPGTIYQ